MWYRNDQDLFELQSIRSISHRVSGLSSDCNTCRHVVAISSQRVGHRFDTTAQMTKWHVSWQNLVTSSINYVSMTNITKLKKVVYFDQRKTIYIMQLLSFLSFLVRILAIFVNRPTLSLKTSTSAGRPTSAAAPRGRYCYEDQFNFAYKLNTGGSDESVERILLSTKTHVTQNFYRKCQVYVYIYLLIETCSSLFSMSFS